MHTHRDRVQPPPPSIMAALEAQEIGARAWVAPAAQRISTAPMPRVSTQPLAPRISTAPMLSFEDVGDTIPDGGVVCHDSAAYAPLLDATGALAPIDGGTDDTAPESAARRNRNRFVPYVAAVVGAGVLVCVLALGRLAYAGLTNDREAVSGTARGPRTPVPSPRARSDAPPERPRGRGAHGWNGWTLP